jgi:hypothetical protein
MSVTVCDTRSSPSGLLVEKITSTLVSDVNLGVNLVAMMISFELMVKWQVLTPDALVSLPEKGVWLVDYYFVISWIKALKQFTLRCLKH